jgi:probable rRNA maturation factor
MYTIHLQNASQTKHPTKKQFQSWIELVLKHLKTKGEITILLVDKPEIRALNKQYRHKDKPTNILSFTTDIELAPLLGDLVICSPLVIEEAKAQQKKIIHHWAHLTIHGVLHLLGYDHENEKEATIMENIEIQLLASLEIGNPYD